jgi:hypothetical protein
LLTALRARPAPPAQLRRMLKGPDASPLCGERAFALSLRDAAAPGAAADAQAALGSSCWREQAQAIALLKRLGIAPDPGAELPSFLRPR